MLGGARGGAGGRNWNIGWKIATQGKYAVRDYRAFATSIAVSSWVSLPCFNASRESSIENFGTMPLFSSIRPCQVR